MLRSDLTRSSPRPVRLIAFGGLLHRWLRTDAAGWHWIACGVLAQRGTRPVGGERKCPECEKRGRR